MSCDRFKEELFDYIGFDDLPNSIKEHLSECPECQTFWSELNSYGDKLGNESEFYPDESISDAFVGEVNARIDELESETKETPIKIINYLLPIAASIVILLGISLSSGYLGNSETNITNNFSGDLYMQYGSYLEEDEDEMDIELLDELLNDYSTSVVSASDEQLLDDLTDEEMEYLKTNFDAGDILL